MPIYSGFSQKRRRVKLLSAGEDQYLMCAPPTIEISATLNDTTNLRNHTLEWTQRLGPTATLSDNYALTATFSHADTEDKVFRFYVDKDTNREQFKDVFLYYTPLSKVKVGVLWGEMTYSNITTKNLVKADGFLFPPLDGLVNGNVIAQPATVFTFDPVTQPGFSNTKVSFEVLGTPGVFTHTPNSVHASYGPLNFPETLTLLPGAYVIRSTFFVGGQTRVFSSPTLVSAPQLQALDNTRIINDVLSLKTAAKGVLRNLARAGIKTLSSASTAHSLRQQVLDGALGQVTRYTHKTITYLTNPELGFTSQTVANKLQGELGVVVRLDRSNIGND